MDFEVLVLILILGTILFIITTWYLFQGINKVILRLFREKKSILTEILKWILFVPSFYILLLVFYFGPSSLLSLSLEDLYEFLDFIIIPTALPYICILLMPAIAIARTISLLIKKLILFIAKKIKKEGKAEIVAEIVSWTFFVIKLILIGMTTVPLSMFIQAFLFRTMNIIILFITIATIIFIISTWYLFQAIDKLLLKIFYQKRLIIAEILKWILFLFGSYAIYSLLFSFVYLFNDSCLEVLKDVHPTLIFISEDPLSLLYLCGYIAIARGVSLLIKKLILFIARGASKQGKVEAVADVISWVFFALALLASVIVILILPVISKPLFF
jgi:hypothetical protein